MTGPQGRTSTDPPSGEMCIYERKSNGPRADVLPLRVNGLLRLRVLGNAPDGRDLPVLDPGMVRRPSRVAVLGRENKLLRRSSHVA